MSSSASSHTLEFHYDISCPFAYIASTRVEALAARTNARLIWRPVLLGAIYRATDAPQGAAGSASDVFNSTKRVVTSKAFIRTLQRYQIPHNQPPVHPLKTTSPLRLLYHADENQRPKLTHALFRAYWVDGKDVSNRAVLQDVVRQAGISGAQSLIKAIETGKHEGEHERSELAKATDIAVKRGTPGVPAFWIEDEIWIDANGERKGGRVYWGQDRMHFVEAVLYALNEGKNTASLSSISKSLHSLVPRCASELNIPAGEQVKLEFWYDFSSPWAFLGWAALPRLRWQFGSRLQVEMKPFLLGILFREIGAPNLPTAAMSPQKRNYSQQDHRDWVRWWNSINAQEKSLDKNIDFYWTDVFPIRTPTILRAVLVEPKLDGVLYRACWELNLDVSDEEVLSSVIAGAGYDAKDILFRANSQTVKLDLRARTKEAIDIGICGVPSYRILRRKEGQGAGEWKPAGDIVWGQDELAVVEDLIAGWDGDGIAKVGDKLRSSETSRL